MTRRATSSLILSLILTIGLAAPAPAQDTPGAQLRDLFDDMVGAVNPYLADLVEMLGDLSGWHAPVRLPNGDILIRRRHDEAPLPENELPEDQLPEDSGPVADPFEL